MSAEKKFPPSASKLRKARSRGDVPRSRDLAQLCVLASMIAVFFFLSSFGDVFSSYHEFLVISLETQAIPSGDIGNIWDSFDVLSLRFCLWLSAILGVPFLGALAGHLAQARGKIAFRRVIFDFSKINFIKGLQRLIGIEESRATKAVFIRFAKSVIVYCLSGAAVIAVPILFISPALAVQPLWDDLVVHICVAFSIAHLGWFVVALFLGVADYCVQYVKWLAGLQMDREEMVREQRDSEGHSEFKQLRRRLHAEISRMSVDDRVRRSRVIITGNVRETE